MKTMIFSGREHHAQKLRSLYEAMGATFVIAENAINIDPPYQSVKNDRHIHLYDFYPPNEHVLDSGPGPYHLISPFWWHQSTRELGNVYMAAAAMLEAERPDIILALHENNFWAKPLIYLASQAGVKTAVFQEGLIRHSDQQTVRKQSMAAEYASILFVWGKESALAYKKAGVKAEIVVSGPPHLDKCYHVKQRGYSKNFTSVVFAPSLTDRSNPVESAFAIKEYCDKEGFRFFLKLHPFVKDESQYKGIEILRLNDPSEVFLLADVIVCGHTTLGLEALGMGVPIVENDLGGLGVEQSWADAGVAERISTKEQMWKIGKAIEDGINTDAKPWIAKNIVVDGKATERVLERLAK